METKNAWGELTYNTPTRAIWVNYTALPEGLGHINYSTHGGLYMFILHNIYKYTTMHSIALTS